MLGKFQKDFLDAVLGADPENDLLKMIRPAGDLSQLQAINVYRGDYSARMMEALGKNYEATWVLMGDEDFMDASKKYIDSHPSSHTNLTAYGKSFPDFLEEEFGDDIVVMARFEKTFWRLFNLQANPPKVILAVDIPTIVFDIKNSIYLFHSTYKLHQLWQVREDNNSELSFDDFEGEQFLAVFKQGEKVAIKELSGTQYSILKCFYEYESALLSMENVENNNIQGSESDWAQIFEILSYSQRKDR
jgi:hypothetical protein